MLVRAIQTGPRDQDGGASRVDDADVLGFSYSGKYQDCITTEHYTSNTFSTTTALQLPGVPATVTIPPLPEYGPKDTCNGVEDAAQQLEKFINRIIALEPDSRFVLVGHSMGGMVAAYFISQQSRVFVTEKIQAVVTLDSPLTGHPIRHPLSKCDVSAISWDDILGYTDVVSSITSIRNPHVLSKFLTINSSDIGDTLDGARDLEIACAPLGGLFGLGHSCGFNDQLALSAISSTVNSSVTDGR